jgi:hypothetical protein
MVQVGSRADDGGLEDVATAWLVAWEEAGLGLFLVLSRQGSILAGSWLLVWVK